MSGEPDYRDLVIEMFADSEANLAALAHSLADDVDRYRLVAQAAIDALGTVHRQLERVTAERFRLEDECRRLREDLFLRADAA